MGSRRPSPPNIPQPPRKGDLPPKRDNRPIPQPPRVNPFDYFSNRPFDPAPQPPSGNRPQPPRPTPPRPTPPRPTPPRPPIPQPPRPTPRPPTTPSGPVTPPTGVTSPPRINVSPSVPQHGRPSIPQPPQVGRRFPDGRPPRPTGFFGPKDPSRVRDRHGFPTAEERRRRRMAGERPMVVERVTTEAPRRSRFREDDTTSRDFEGFRQRRPKRDVNIAQQDI